MRRILVSLDKNDRPSDIWVTPGTCLSLDPRSMQNRAHQLITLQSRGHFGPEGTISSLLRLPRSDREIPSLICIVYLVLYA